VGDRVSVLSSISQRKPPASRRTPRARGRPSPADVRLHVREDLSALSHQRITGELGRLGAADATRLALDA
jgi:hypothetical protein